MLVLSSSSFFFFFLRFIFICNDDKYWHYTFKKSGGDYISKALMLSGDAHWLWLLPITNALIYKVPIVSQDYWTGTMKQSAWFMQL